MKKSNKLLLGGFLTMMLIIAAIHITLYANYKNGNYTVYHPEDERGTDKMQSIPGVSVVIVRNLYGAEVQFGDKAEVEKFKENVIQYVQKGDSLFITGQYTNTPPDIRHLVNITLPYSVTLSAVNSSLYLEKGEKDVENNPVINLQNSHAIFFGSSAPFLLGHVKVVASDRSIAAFHGNTQVNELDVQLSNSALEYTEGDPGQLSIMTDSISRLTLQSKQFLKAKITTLPTNP